MQLLKDNGKIILVPQWILMIYLSKIMILRMA
jgi:hypothetical protein